MARYNHKALDNSNKISFFLGEKNTPTALTFTIDFSIVCVSAVIGTEEHKFLLHGIKQKSIDAGALPKGSTDAERASAVKAEATRIATTGLFTNPEKASGGEYVRIDKAKVEALSDEDKAKLEAILGKKF